MTPAARISAAIEILDDMLDGAHAEKALSGWARRSRFAGSKDRAALRDHVFGALRCRRSFAALGGAGTGRGLMIGALRAQGVDPAEFFTGEGHAPEPLTAAELAAGSAPTGAARLDIPDWVWPLFEASLGEAAEQAALALQSRAPVMLRVNLRQGTRAQAIARLADEGITAHPHDIAETALHVTEGERKISGSACYNDGLVELQDGSSQAAMARLEIAPGARVMDYCAGGGGKVLALAARAAGVFFAHDTAPQRMKDLPVRAERAGVNVTIVETGRLRDEAPFDLVLCDAPCSGSGTWRRTPESKWALTPRRLDELTKIQRQILQNAAPLVAQNGILAYATCSIFNEENQRSIGHFLSTNPDWQMHKEAQLSLSDGGDGFYIAQLQRKS
ncbi:MAG: RsmB/NOP family class I SAM-dependent RNA methyltransferase [Roseovarius sp.]|nr:RsmB/NOP family class I SAM-dependent RNA methyltransferase [Roseovarius sp.]